MKKQDVIKALMILEKWFPTFKVLDDEMMIDGWAKRMVQYSDAEVKQAIELIIDNETYAPTPAVMKKYVEMLGGNNSNEVLRLFQDAVRKFGSYRSQEATEWIKSQSLIAYKVIMAIGFHRLCQMEQKNANQLIHKTFTEKRVKMNSNVKAIEAKAKEPAQKMIDFGDQNRM